MRIIGKHIDAKLLKIRSAIKARAESRAVFIFHRASRDEFVFCFAMQEQYFVYVLLGNDQSYFVGLTDNLLQAVEAHIQGVHFSTYTFNRRPVVLKYYETIPFPDDAKKSRADKRIVTCKEKSAN